MGKVHGFDDVAARLAGKIEVAHCGHESMIYDLAKLLGCAENENSIIEAVQRLKNSFDSSQKLHEYKDHIAGLMADGYKPFVNEADAQVIAGMLCKECGVKLSYYGLKDENSPCIALRVCNNCGEWSDF